jgi:hypothetical protein
VTPADAGAEDAVLALLATRAAGATVCPSEVARVLAAADGVDWRDRMATVHATVDRLVDAGRVRLSWKGQGMVARQGPYRIAAPPVIPLPVKP